VTAAVLVQRAKAAKRRRTDATDKEAKTEV